MKVCRRALLRHEPQTGARGIPPIKGHMTPVRRPFNYAKSVSQPSSQNGMLLAPADTLHFRRRRDRSARTGKRIQMIPPQRRSPDHIPKAPQSDPLPTEPLFSKGQRYTFIDWLGAPVDEIWRGLSRRAPAWTKVLPAMAAKAAAAGTRDVFRLAMALFVLMRLMLISRKRTTDLTHLPEAEHSVSTHPPQTPQVHQPPTSVPGARRPSPPAFPSPRAMTHKARWRTARRWRSSNARPAGSECSVRLRPYAWRRPRPPGPVGEASPRTFPIKPRTSRALEHGGLRRPGPRQPDTAQGGRPVPVDEPPRPQTEAATGGIDTPGVHIANHGRTFTRCAEFRSAGTLEHRRPRTTEAPARPAHRPPSWLALLQVRATRRTGTTGLPPKGLQIIKVLLPALRLACGTRIPLQARVQAQTGEGNKIKTTCQ